MKDQGQVTAHLAERFQAHLVSFTVANAPALVTGLDGRADAMVAERVIAHLEGLE